MTIAIIIIAMLLLIIFYFIGVYNKLVNGRNKVKDQFSQIDVQLKRRVDLIPNLVETVKGYAKHENNTLKEVIEARNKLNSATGINEEIDANNQLTGALNRLFALSEAYPDLKANTNFIQLQDELAGTENRIAVSRKDYNDAVKSYNQMIKSFPKNIVAGMFGFEKKAYFEISESEKEVPNVSFE